MREVMGAYNTAKIFTDLVEDSAIAQVKTLCDQYWAKDSKIRLMPDIHAGKGCTIGTTMTIEDYICPNLVGVDIGCGVTAARIDREELSIEDLKELDRVIHEYVPAGKNVHQREDELIKVLLKELYCLGEVNIDYAARSLGSLGGGKLIASVSANN